MTERWAPLAAVTSERRVRFVPDDRVPVPYELVPFDVGSGIRALSIELRTSEAGSVDGPDDRSVVDLGLIGPGSTGEGTPAFRGWSGSERSIVVLSEQAATPGYRPGAIEPGRWHVLLGLYRIASGGCDAVITLRQHDAPVPIPDGPPDPPDSPAAAPLPARPVRRFRAEGAFDQTLHDAWIPYDLHAHSAHSDGAESVPQIARRAADSGLAGLVLTDHNTDAHRLDLDAVNAGPDPAVTLVPGEEVTTYAGHLGAIGVDGWIDFRHTDPTGIARAIATIHDRGGLASVNHPADPALGWQFGSDLDFDCIEVWNGPWSPEDDEAIDWWSSLLAAGRRVVAVGGSDSHGPDRPPLGHPTTWVRARRPGREQLLAAIRAGAVAVTRDPLVPPPELEVRDDSRTGGPVVRWQVRGARGADVLLIVDGFPVVRLPLGADDAAGSWEPADGSLGWVRLEVRGRNGALIALTNPQHRQGTG